MIDLPALLHIFNQKIAGSCLRVQQLLHTELPLDCAMDLPLLAPGGEQEQALLLQPAGWVSVEGERGNTRTVCRHVYP